MSIDWNLFADTIHEHQSFALTTHLRPDCDALGSELGMAAILESLGKTVSIANPHGLPPNLAFIDPDRRVRQIGKDVTPAEIAGVDVLMVLDTSAWAQLGDMGDVIRNTQAKRVILDHHQSSDDLAALVFRDTHAEATGRLVVEAADALQVPLSREMAMPLFAALATDTGWFRFSSTTPTTYQVAARLVAAGASPTAIYKQLYEQDTLARVNLRGHVLKGARTQAGGRVVYGVASQADFAETGALSSDTEDVINMMMVVAGVEVALLFVELEPGRCKASFRSTGAIDCSQMAARFGGGGHKAAAGATMNMPLAEAVEQVLAAVQSALG